jgi:DNA polymerase III subunit epsilon
VYLFIDSETTGLPKSWSASIEEIDNWPRIVQLAWAIYDVEGNKECSKNYIIFPTGFKIPKDTVKIHGITTERAKREGVHLHKVLPELNSDIDKITTIVAHNIDFDLPIINAEFLRSGIKTNLLKKKNYCTMKSPKVVSLCKIPNQYRRGYKWPKLCELHATLFGSDFEDSHNAGVDVEACASCFFELRNREII